MQVLANRTIGSRDDIARRGVRAAVAARSLNDTCSMANGGQQGGNHSTADE